MKRILKKKEILLIKWIDSHGITSEWEFKDELKPLKPCECMSVGFLVEKTREYITIALGDSETQYLGRLTIPMRSVIKVKILK